MSRTLGRHLVLVSGAALVVLVFAAALLAPLLAPQEHAAQTLDRRLEAPSGEHPLGLDELGRDILSRMLWGARVSLGVGLAVVVLAGGLGTLIGAVAGFVGGKVDGFLMRACDVVLAFPGILLAIALVAVLGPALRHVVVALVLIGWVSYARLVRGQVLQLRELEFVLAARAGAVLAEASLSFLGLGIQPPTPSWGAMIDAGRSHLLDAPHLALFPGLAILLTVMGLNFLGDGLVDYLDPRQKRLYERSG